MEPEFELGERLTLDRQILAVVSSHFSGRSSGVTMAQRMWLVVTVRAAL